MTDLVVDLFAGGGGASHGVERALGRHVDIAINHDAHAIEMHSANHPHTRHLCESIFDVDPVEVCGGRPVDFLWASPDCTHHSRANGGKPREKKIRALAWVVVRWAATVAPSIIALAGRTDWKLGLSSGRRSGRPGAVDCTRAQTNAAPNPDASVPRRPTGGRMIGVPQSDRRLLATRAPLEILEHLWNASRTRKQSVNFVDLREHLIAAKGWGTQRALRVGPGGHHADYLGSCLALLDELGCIERRGWLYRFKRHLRHDDFAPVVSADIDTEPNDAA